jgi:signal transduction histidine kinase/CheY-like chemotaxis protein
MQGIALRFWLLVSLLLSGLMLAGAGIEARLAYLDSVAAAERAQRLEARAAADRISQYLGSIESQIRDAATLAWDSGALSSADLQEEFHRVMKLVPAISEMRNVDSRGKERLYVSRTEKDRIDSRSDVPEEILKRAQAAPIVYGPVVFHEGARPFVSLAVRESVRPPSGASIAELDLKFVTDVVQGIAIGKTGTAYVVDRRNRLVAHPNLSLVLRETNVASLPHVAAARDAIAESPDAGLPTRWSHAIDGTGVLVSAVHIPGPDWLLFAEEPEAEALAPVRIILYRTAALLVAGIVVAFVASRFLAGALTRPILRLREGATRIAGGRLDARIDVKTGDEIESLADEFNRMAERLEESYSGLEAKVEARTRELAAARDQVQRQARELEVLNQELTVKVGELGLRKDEAEKANAAKTRFLASASHDLRQPLHTIGLLAGILRDRTRSDDARDLACKVEASVAVMQNLFSSLLDISKLDAGAIRPSIVDFQVDDVLKRVEANYAPQAMEKGLAFEVVKSSAVVRSDPIVLERILGNLVTNAIRYTNQGRILAGCRRCGEKLRILVLDTGIGIAAADLAIVFDEFVQLANPERDRSKGLGLGLSIVKRSADLLGHPLIVRSTPGKGSIFGIEVPLSGAATAAARAGLEASPHAGSLEGAFVIVIDDDPASRAAMEALLRHWGCHVAAAGSPDEATRALDAHLRAPDLIVTDYRLPEGTAGIDAIVAIRMQAEPRVPAIVVTGDVTAPVLDEARLEAVALLHKPVDIEMLRRTARAFLDAHLD